MKIILSILFLLQFSTVLSAQIVTTFAGTVDSIGSMDGQSEATFNNPHGIAIGQNGNIYICDRFNHIVRKITPTGQVITLAGQPGIFGDIDGLGSAARFYEPWGICVDQNDNVYVADTRNNKIRKITADGVVTTFAGTGNFGITNGPANNSTFGQPVGIETDGNGNFYVSDHGTHIIRKITANGIVTTLAGGAFQTGDVDGSGVNARFNKPYGLTLDLDGNIIVADEWNHKIRKITPDGIVTTIAGLGAPGGVNGPSTIATFNFPWDVSLDSNGDIYVADGINYAIRKIAIDGNIDVTTYAGQIGTAGYQDGVGSEAKFSGATGLAFSPLTKELFIGDAFNHVIRKVSDPQQGVFLVANDNATVYCPNESILFNTFPDVFDQFNFYIDNSLVATSATPDFDAIGLDSGTHTISVVAMLDTIEITSDEIMFEIFEVSPASIDTIGSTTFFEGDSVILVASFGIDYFWSNGLDSPILTVKESGIYSVEVTDANGCTSQSTAVEITVRSDPDAILIEANGSTTICEGDQLLLQSNQSQNGQWFKDGWPITGANMSTYQAMEAGIYQAQYVDGAGTVVISNMIEIFVLLALEIDFVVDKTTVKQNDIVQFSIINNNLISATWDFGDGNKVNSTSSEQVYQYTNIGLYDVQLIGTDDRGCLDTLMKTDYVSVVSDTEIELQNDLFIASAFTPNGDGTNDFLTVRGSDIVDMKFKVFSDQGCLMFESNTQQQGWDGTFKNKKAPSGNYLYELNYTDVQGSDRVKIGKTVLLK